MFDYHKKDVQLSNKQNFINTFEDSFPLQMSNSVLRRLRLLVLLQKMYFMYTCKNIAKKPNLHELLPTKLFVQYRIENCGKKKICVATDRFLSSNTLFIDIFIFFYLLF